MFRTYDDWKGMSDLDENPPDDRRLWCGACEHWDCEDCPCCHDEESTR